MAETPRHVRALNREPMSVGGYTRTINTPEDPFNTRTRAFMGDPDALEQLDPNDPENASAETTKKWARAFERADNNRIEQRGNADAFIATCPEWVDTEANGEILNRTLEALYGQRVYTVSEFRKAYEVCRANYSPLTVNQAELKKQEQAAKQQRAAEVKAHSATPSEEELYSMDLDDLRRLDAIESQKRMQRIGEEGGW